MYRCDPTLDVDIWCIAKIVNSAALNWTMWLQWHWTAQQVGVQTFHPADRRAARPSRINKQLRMLFSCCRLSSTSVGSSAALQLQTDNKRLHRATAHPGKYEVAFYKIERCFTTVTPCVCVCVLNCTTSTSLTERRTFCSTSTVPNYSNLLPRLILQRTTLKWSASLNIKSVSSLLRSRQPAKHCRI